MFVVWSVRGRGFEARHGCRITSDVFRRMDARFFWPFNFDLGHGIELRSATAQPVCAINEGRTRIVFFAETPGIPAEFIFDPDVALKADGGKVSVQGDRLIARQVKPGVRPALQIETAEGPVQIVLLANADSLALWKGNWHGCDRVFLTPAGLVLDGENLRLT